MVQSLGDLAKLDEPEFSLRSEAVDAGELLDDIALRFAERAARQGVALRTLPAAGASQARPGRGRCSTSSCSSARSPTWSTTRSSSARAAAPSRSPRERRGGSVEVSVADDGPGIPSADLPQLFDRFYQSRPTVAPATAEGGRGLGLAIVKRIAELHGGDVAVESTLGRGTRVVLTLPAAAGTPRPRIVRVADAPRTGKALVPGFGARARVARTRRRHLAGAVPREAARRQQRRALR